MGTQSTVLLLSVFLLTIQLKGEIIWKALTERYSVFSILFFGTYIFSFTSFFVSSFLYYLVDRYKPISLTRYKIQKDKDPFPNYYNKALTKVLFNYTLVAVPSSYILFYLFHPISPLHSNNFYALEYYKILPSIYEIIRDILFFLIITELGFYYIHRLLHLPLFYSKYHKQHHEFTAPIGLAAVYCSTFEFIFSNMYPLIVGPLILKSHPFTVYLWMSIANISTVSVHSGYDLPFMRPAASHDYHHEKFNCMYGVIGILDKLHNTEGDFWNRKQK